MNITDTRDLVQVRKLDQLIVLAGHAMQIMEPGTISRLRASTKQFISQRYGKGSSFWSHYRKIDSWNSLYNLQEVKGVLQAMRDEIGDELEFYNAIPKDSILREESSPVIRRLTGIILSLFYENVHYNWDAIKNLIELNSDYFEFRVHDAADVFEKFKNRNIIAFTGLGQAYCITDQGKKLYEQRYAPGLKTPSSSAILIDQRFFFEVFVCHASKDKPFLEKVLAEFQQRGISYWLDEEQIRPGDIAIDKLSEGLLQSRFILVCISRNQFASNWSQFEYQSMLTSILSNESGQTLLPFVLDDTLDKDIPPFLRPIKRMRLSKPDEYKQLLTFLTQQK